MIEALANSSVIFQNGANVTNLSGNTLTGGIWRANSLGGSSALIDFQGTNTSIATNNADIYLIGANSVIQARDAGNVAQLYCQGPIISGYPQRSSRIDATGDTAAWQTTRLDIALVGTLT